MGSVPSKADEHNAPSANKVVEFEKFILSGKKWTTTCERLEDISFLIKCPESNDATPHEKIVLSPFDDMNAGRAISMVWHYSTRLSCTKLTSSLREIIVDYPVLAGRYASSPPSPSTVILNNKGIYLQICTSEESYAQSVSHLQPKKAGTRVCRFKTIEVERFLPNNKADMDPDTHSPNAPLLSIKITLHENGTTIGVLLQHGLVDAQAQMSFMTRWSRRFRNLSFENLPSHERNNVGGDNQSTNDQDGTVDADARSGKLRLKLVDPGVASIPEFAPVIGKIMGDAACKISFSVDEMREFKNGCQKEIKNDGSFVSTDDVITAKVWKALCLSRCKQLGISHDSRAHRCTCLRALNLRNRVVPSLSSTYCGNAVINFPTVLDVCDLLSWSVCEVALALRANIKKYTPKRIAALHKWAKAQQQADKKIKYTFDSNGLSFIISSWIFPDEGWRDVNFNSVPVCFEHGCFAPIVTNFTSNANGDGIDIWTSGTSEAVDCFSSFLTS